MKIEYIQISNVLSFPYVEDTENAEKITFDNGLNIIIGENGSGKSTALEVLNFLFKRVIYKQYNIDQDLLLKRDSKTKQDQRNIIRASDEVSVNRFRLNPNWHSEHLPQTLRISVRLDEIDQNNITTIINNLEIISKYSNLYSKISLNLKTNYREQYLLDVVLNRESNRFTVNFQDSGTDFGYTYLSEYNYFKNIILLNNMINHNNPITPLHDSFTLISSYRNYHAFQPSISLRNQYPSKQIQEIQTKDYSKSLNISDDSEPSIFGIVRLRVAEKHFELMSGEFSTEQSEEKANQSSFILAINQKLKIVHLKCRIRLVDLRTWTYSFEFFDLRRGQTINDINILSAGQKSIIHLVFEAYGRGDLKGGVVIIDEPEIHLHYQFQHEYLQVAYDLNKEQNCQYILVTHSDSLINSNTINNIRRFSLSKEGYTKIFSPNINTDKKNLIKILDNTRSTYAFFAKKIVLVEGDTDRYFFRAVISSKFPNLNQDIAILHMGGKGEYVKWSSLFVDFGLDVYFISDFDFIVDRHYPSELGTRLKTEQEIEDFKSKNNDWEERVNSEYKNDLFILKEGNLEQYLGISKGLTQTIEFCENNLDSFLSNDTSSKSKEINWIVTKIVS